MSFPLFYFREEKKKLTRNRIRRVKCDETRPECERCTKAGRTCDGYASSTTSHQSRRALATAVRQLHVAGPASRVLGDPLPVDDAACFDFFRLCTASMTGSVLPGEFWTGQLLQASHAEPAVWRAVVAIGALHRRWEHVNVQTERRDEQSIARFTDEGVRHYLRAISLAKSVRNPVSLAVVSVALAAAAHLAGRWAECHTHIRGGLRLVRRMEAGDLVSEISGARPEPADLDALAHTLERLDLQAMTFSDARVPYDYATADVPRADLLPSSVAATDLDLVALGVFRLFRRFCILGTAVGRGLMSVADFEAARQKMIADSTALKHILNQFEISLLRQEQQHRLQKLQKQQQQQQQQQSQNQKQKQKQNQKNISSSSSQNQQSQTQQRDSSPDPTQESQILHRNKLLSLHLYHTFTNLGLAASLVGPESRWDAHLPFFRQIVSLAAKISRNTASPLPFFLSLEPGIALPLFLVVTRCRHPIVRRQALALLRGLNRQEGVWNCKAAAGLAGEVLAVEEEGLGIGDSLPLYVCGGGGSSNGDDLDLDLDLGAEGVRDRGRGRGQQGLVTRGEGGDGDDERFFWPAEVGGWPRVPEANRMVLLQTRLDVEANRVEQEIIVAGEDGRGRLARTVAVDI